MVDYGGTISLIDAGVPARWHAGAKAGALFPEKIVFTPGGVQVTFDASSGKIVRECAPAAGGALSCQDSP